LPLADTERAEILPAFLLHVFAGDAIAKLGKIKRRHQDSGAKSKNYIVPIALFGRAPKPVKRRILLVSMKSRKYRFVKPLRLHRRFLLAFHYFTFPEAFYDGLHFGDFHFQHASKLVHSTPVPQRFVGPIHPICSDELIWGRIV